MALHADPTERDLVAERVGRKLSVPLEHEAFSQPRRVSDSSESFEQ